MTAPDRRRSGRVWTTLWLAVDGAHATLTPRRVNVSASGIYFDAADDLGGPGTVHWLHLSSDDRAVTLQIMACIVRVDYEPDGGRKGIALEFMPESDAAHLELRNFLHYALALATEDLLKRVEAEASRRDSFVLTCVREVPVGAAVRLEITPPQAETPSAVLGHTVACKPSSDGAKFEIEVLIDTHAAIAQNVEAPLKRFSSKAMQAVRVREDGPQRRFTPARGVPFPARTPPPAPARTPGAISDELDGIVDGLFSLPATTKAAPPSHLEGDIERIPLPTLLSMLALEALTGRVVIEHPSGEVALLVRRGQIVDLEPPPPDDDVRATLARVLSTSQGRFRVELCEVDRRDRVETSMMALLLDLARERDEASSSHASHDVC